MRLVGFTYRQNLLGEPLLKLMYLIKCWIDGEMDVKIYTNQNFKWSLDVLLISCRYLNIDTISRLHLRFIVFGFEWLFCLPLCGWWNEYQNHKPKNPKWTSVILLISCRYMDFSKTTKFIQRIWFLVLIYSIWYCLDGEMNVKTYTDGKP